MNELYSAPPSSCYYIDWCTDKQLQWTHREPYTCTQQYPSHPRINDTAGKNSMLPEESYASVQIQLYPNSHNYNFILTNTL